jgi:hypothetical protein
MPSPTHQILVELFRRCPTLLTDLLDAAAARGTILPLALPPGARIVPTTATFTDLLPSEFRADLALHVLPSGAERPRRTFLLEPQLGRDQKKRYTWPLYSAGARARDRCPVTSIVLALDAPTARWAARRIVLDPLGTHIFQPIVLGPDEIPRITDHAQARAMPELTLLSALVHCRTRGGEHTVFAALAAACPMLDSELRVIYFSVVRALLTEDVQRPLEALMHFEGNSVDQHVFRYYYNLGVQEANKDPQGARAETLRDILGKLLTQRFGSLSEDALARIRAADVEMLTHWCERLISAPSLDDLLDSKP